jgi:HlyD family secretion protein
LFTGEIRLYGLDFKDSSMDDLSKTMAELPSVLNNKKGPGNWKAVLLAIAVPMGLVAVIWFVFREQLTPAAPVETDRVILLAQDSETQRAMPSSAEEMLFQASGWVEPDPWPIKLAVKVNGFVDQVFIREGERITNGQVVATLDATDAQLALETAMAEARQHEATIETRKHALLESNRQTVAAEFKVEAAVARLGAKQNVEARYQKTPAEVIPPVERISAEQAVIEFQAEEQIARAELSARRAQCIRIGAEVKEAEAALTVASKKQEAAQLALDRTLIRSTMDGIVMRRYINPGDKRMVGADDPTSAAVAALYDPNQLQIRVDVPIAEAGKITIGQPARIFSALLPGQTMTGSVTQITGQADLQRNTLQVKVRIDDPDPKLRPDILCRVEFWNAASSGRPGNVTSGSHTLWIPVDALLSADTEQSVWVVDPLTQVVNRRNIKLATASRDGFRLVTDGLRANELVVTKGQQALEEGARVKEVNQ